MQFYVGFEPTAKATTINWRVYALLQSGVHSRVGRGKLTLGKSRIFILLLTTRIKNIYTRLHKQFTNLCVEYLYPK
jgi:hypothetical protein